MFFPEILDVTSFSERRAAAHRSCTPADKGRYRHCILARAARGGRTVRSRSPSSGVAAWYAHVSTCLVRELASTTVAYQPFISAALAATICQRIARLARRSSACAAARSTSGPRRAARACGKDMH